MGKKLVNVVLYIWMFPQNLLGLVFLFILNKKIVCRIKSERVHSHIIYIDKEVEFAAISLGQYLFISSTFYDKETIERHEEGHYIQSRYFGPIYLIVIGIPSLVTNILSMCLYKVGKTYMLENYYNT